MRSMLFVPADSERKLARGLESGADALILDLEDSVVVSNHPTARRLARDFLEAHGPEGSAPFLVRWIESGHQALVFPGPDAVIVTAAEQSERDRATGRSNLISGHPG